MAIYQCYDYEYKIIKRLSKMTHQLNSESTTHLVNSGLKYLERYLKANPTPKEPLSLSGLSNDINDLNNIINEKLKHIEIATENKCESVCLSLVATNHSTIFFTKSNFKPIYFLTRGRHIVTINNEIISIFQEEINHLNSKVSYFESMLHTKEKEQGAKEKTDK